ncbi:hypothetical protein COOONC_12108, partial [Cooperia oncophora]
MKFIVNELVSLCMEFNERCVLAVLIAPIFPEALRNASWTIVVIESTSRRSFQRLIEKAARLQRKRLRGQKREKLRRERKARHSVLKKAIRDAKAIQKAAAAAEGSLWFDRRLKRLEAASRRREEKARRRAEHETRKEARRAKRDKKRGRKRRDPNKVSSASKKSKDALNAIAGTGAAGAAAAGTILGS